MFIDSYLFVIVFHQLCARRIYPFSPSTCVRHSFICFSISWEITYLFYYNRPLRLYLFALLLRQLSDYLFVLLMNYLVSVNKMPYILHKTVIGKH